jgi:hypothetical protein
MPRAFNRKKDRLSNTLLGKLDIHMQKKENKKFLETN